MDSHTMNTQTAINNALAFGGGTLPHGMGMMAGILPAALKIEEHKNMRKIADRYYEQYIKDFNRKYGFSDKQIETLVDEFKTVTEQICKLIPDKKMRDMYKKYIESYPTMYLSMIPAEALQTKLAVKCVTENNVLRTKIESMSKCVSTLVRNLTDLQISAGIPPIVNLMFESMPDPLTAMTDPLYHKYNKGIGTYHALLDDTEVDQTLERLDGNKNTLDIEGKPGPGLENETLLRMEPVSYLKGLLKKGGKHTTKAADSSRNQEVPPEDIQDLLTIMENMQTKSGCQPFGDEWNHMGPTPAMNPAMCLGEDHRMQPGNPRHEVGRTSIYQAERDQSGNARWVQKGVIPDVAGEGAPQMVQHQGHGQQNPNLVNSQSYTPGIDKRPMSQEQQVWLQGQQRAMQQQMQTQQQQQQMQMQQQMQQQQMQPPQPQSVHGTQELQPGQSVHASQFSNSNKSGSNSRNSRTSGSKKSKKKSS